MSPLFFQIKPKWYINFIVIQQFKVLQQSSSNVESDVPSFE